MPNKLGHRIIELGFRVSPNIVEDAFYPILRKKHAVLLREVDPDESELRHEGYYQLTTVDGVVMHVLINHEFGLDSSFLMIGIDVDLAVGEDASWSDVVEFLQELNKSEPSLGDLSSLYIIYHVKYLVDINMSEINESSDDWIGLLDRPRYIPDSKLYRSKMPYNGSVRAAVSGQSFYYICKPYCSTFEVIISTRPDPWRTINADIVRFSLDYQPNHFPTVSDVSDELMGQQLLSHAFNSDHLIWCYRLTIGWGDYCTIREIHERIQQQAPDREKELLQQILHFNNTRISSFPYTASKKESDTLTKLMVELDALGINLIITPDKHRKCLLKMWMDRSS